MSFFLPKLSCKKEIDDAVKSVAEKVLVLRFGRDEDSVCLQLDEIVSYYYYYHLITYYYALYVWLGLYHFGIWI